MALREWNPREKREESSRGYGEGFDLHEKAKLKKRKEKSKG
jgi:hypothetical protein